jgi:hypothetical protein
MRRGRRQRLDRSHAHRLDLAVETIALRREFASIVPEEIKAAARASRKRVERRAA